MFRQSEEWVSDKRADEITSQQTCVCRLLGFKEGKQKEGIYFTSATLMLYYIAFVEFKKF